MSTLLMQPVGMPGLVAFGTGGLLFFASLIWTRIGADRGGRGASVARSNLSRWGIFIQMLGFFATGFGGIRSAWRRRTRRRSPRARPSPC